MAEEKITVTFTMKLNGLIKIPQNDFAASMTIGEIQRVLAKKAPTTKGVFVYVFVNDSFMPTPDETVGNLTDVFGTKGGPNEKRCLSLCCCLQVYQG